MKRHCLVAGFCVVLAATGWRVAEACAPDFWMAVFSYKRHPDLPRRAFIGGRLGVLQPTFARSYLVIAYRYLNGVGMSAGEREQASDYYKDRETGTWDRSGTDWPARWQEARWRISSPRPRATPLITGGQLAYDPETHSFALNCAEDAFRTAIHTLTARRDRFGASSRAFRSWLEAQDIVFANCLGGSTAIPEKASAELPALIRADRQYQIAAAQFYSGRYAAALEGFRQIGRDAASPWSRIARYLVVRTLLRLTEDPKTAVTAGAQLNEEAARILSDAKLTTVHGMTLNLVQRAGIRERDHSYFLELARLLSAPGQDDGFREVLWNYTDLYDHVIGEADPNSPFRSSKAHSDPANFRDADLSDWIYCFQSRDASMLPHSIVRWKQTRSEAWLLAGLGHANATIAAKEGLIEAAEAISESSPGYLTARFHLFRIYEQAGKREAARDGVTALLGSPLLRDLPSSVNLFRGLGMLSAPTFQDFLRLATREPVLVTFDVNEAEAPDFVSRAEIATFAAPKELLDSDATRVLNRATPFRLLREAALTGSLPPALRREALMTAFTRGLMLDQDLADISEALRGEQPDLASPLDAYVREQTAEGRRFAAALLLLKHPEARPYFASGISRQTRPGRIDDYRDNWWCPMNIETELDSRASQGFWGSLTPNVLQSSTKDVAPEFLGANTAEEARRESEKLGALGAATDFLGGIVLDYAKANARDPRVPEALHDVVRSGHYGCADVNTWKTTRAAFRLLHLRYPRSEWAKRTPTWFKNDFDIRREIQSRRGEEK
jgi:hypothetical protein